MKKGNNIITVILAMMLIFCSCNGVRETGETETDIVEPDNIDTENDTSGSYYVSLYSSWDNGMDFYMDNNGNLIENHKDYVKQSVIGDLLTGEKIYICDYYFEDTGEDDEYGNPVIQIYSKLSDMDGNNVTDWIPYYFSDGINGLVFKGPYRDWFSDVSEPGELWNPKTGETIFEGIYNLYGYDDCICIMDENYVGKYLLDENLQIIADLSDEKFDDMVFSESKSGVYLFTDYDKGSALYDKNFNLIYKTNGNLNITYYILKGDFATERNGQETVFYSLPSMERIFETTDRVDYFDGETAVVRKDSGSSIYNLKTKNTVSDEFITIKPINGEYSDEKETEGFYALSKETVYKLDLNGNVINKAEVPGIISISSSENMLEYTVSEYDSETYERTEKTGVLDSEFNIIIPAEYDYVSHLSYSENGKMKNLPYYYGAYNNDAGAARYAILDAKGNIIVSDLSAYGTADERCVAVVKGFTVGLMGYDGKWISQNSIYGSQYID